MSSSRKRRRIASDSGRGEKSKQHTDEIPTPQVGDSKELFQSGLHKEEKRNRRPPRKSRRQRQLLSSKNEWKVSPAVGGHFVDADPIFSADERHIILAHSSAVHIYSTATSSLVRSLPVTSPSSKNGAIVGYALSATLSNHLYACTSEGLVYHWDWLEGKMLGRWKLGSRVFGIALGVQRASGLELDIVYTREQENGRWRMSAHKLIGGADASKTESKTLLRSHTPITAFQCVLDGKVIVAASGEKVIIGASNEGATSPLRDTTYTWREFQSSDWITSLDVRLSPRTDPNPMSSRKAKRPDTIDAVINVVVGDTKGVVFAHEDLLNKLVRREMRAKGAMEENISPRKLHWHRQAVNSVRWSRDGNYAISGGSETVLVLWQLDTNKRQFLPHLSSAIENIVVSPTGSSYAIMLSDNSTMILSTSELSPTANIAGIQAKTFERQLPWSGAHVKTVNSRGPRSAWSAPLRPPMTINPKLPHQLLIAVPAAQASPASVAMEMPYLQAFDFVSDRHVSRQALTRTNATTLNINPDAFTIGEPCIKAVQVSFDGQWLASIDEWVPPRHNVEHLSLDAAGLQNLQSQRREVYLRFWAWNSLKEVWELVTRIDGPHTLRSGLTRSGSVMDLRADPSRLGFATIGQDGAVKTWQPKARIRGGVVVRGTDAKGLTTWSCDHEVKLDAVGKQFEHQSSHPPGHRFSSRGFVTYSADGSILAASEQEAGDNVAGLVHFIETSTGSVRETRAGLYAGKLSALGFVRQYLITVSEHLIVWDVAKDALHYGYSIREQGFSDMTSAAMTHLAVDQDNGTFAVAIPVVESGDNDGDRPSHTQKQLLEGAQARLLVFNPEAAAPLISASLPRLVTGLIHVAGSRGYVTLDTEAEVRAISPRNLFDTSSMTEISPSLPGSDGLGPLTVDGDGDRITKSIYDSASEKEQEEEEEEEENVLAPGDATDDDFDAAMVRPEQLTEIFDTGPAYTLQAVETLFEQVAGLFAGKPFAAGQES